MSFNEIQAKIKSENTAVEIDMKQSLFIFFLSKPYEESVSQKLKLMCSVINNNECDVIMYSQSLRVPIDYSNLYFGGEYFSVFSLKMLSNEPVLINICFPFRIRGTFQKLNSIYSFSFKIL